MSQPTPKNGNNLSANLCVKECMFVFVRESQNDSSPLSQSSWTLILCSFSLIGRRVGDCGGTCALYSPQKCPTSQIPLRENILFLLWADSVITPRNQPVLSPTSTSQQRVPESKPSEPRIHANISNLSGLSGSVSSSSLYLMLVRSSDTMTLQWAVLGFKVTGAEERQQTRVKNCNLN